MPPQSPLPNALDASHESSGDRPPADTATIPNEPAISGRRDTENETPVIGTEGEPLRVLALAGGGLDTAMQVGTIHALLVCDAKEPDIVVGVSAGAVNAVATATVLQAGGTLEDSRSRQTEQVSKLREILAAYRQFPDRALRQLIPDFFEVNARAPLRPLETPLIPPSERNERQKAIFARFGVIRLLNGLSSMRLKVRELTLIIRLVLEMRRISALRHHWLTRLCDRLVRSKGKEHDQFSRALYRMAAVADAVGSFLFRFGWKLYYFLELVLRMGVIVIRNPRLLFHTVNGMISGGFVRSGKEIHLNRGSRQSSASLWRKLLSRGRKCIIWLFGLNHQSSALHILLGHSIRSSFLKIAIAAAHIVSLALCALILSWGVAIVLVFGWRLDWAWAIEFMDWIQSLPRFESIWRWWIASTIGAMAVVGSWPVARVLGFGPYHALRRLLASLGIERDLVTDYVVKPLFVKLFDPRYYDPALGDDQHRARRMLQMLESEHGGAEPQPADTNLKARTLRSFLNGRRPIYVAPVAAEIAKGEMEALHPDDSVVDALVAATALVPFFSAQKLPVHGVGGGTQEVDGKLGSDARGFFIDAGNISNEPTRAIFELLANLKAERPLLTKPWRAKSKAIEKILNQRLERITPPAARLAKGISGVEVYSVTPFPVSSKALAHRSADGKKTEIRGSPQIAARALRLQRYQEAGFERRMADIYRKAVRWAPRSKEEEFDQNSKAFFNLGASSGTQKWIPGSQIIPIEIDRPRNARAKWLRAQNDSERDSLFFEMVADGCRSTLETLLSSQLNAEAAHGKSTIACRAVMTRRRGGELLPGAERSPGAGLPEICRHCTLNGSSHTGDTRRGKGQRLRSGRGAREQTGVDWPRWDATRSESPAHGDNKKTVAPPPPVEKAPDQNEKDPLPGLENWPKARQQTKKTNRPTVSFLFSGGVFRGVFQVGVLNGLSEAGLRPDLVAGTSVGSIMAAISAEVFRKYPGDREDDGTDQAHRRGRALEIIRVASAFLALDRLVLTDRFVDFTRHLTLRAGDASFSLRDADLLFRRFDQLSFKTINRSIRLTLAGIERLFHVSPFELKAMTKAARSGERDDLVNQLEAQTEKFLEKSGIGEELLGAEPLEELIRELVLADALPNRFAEAAKSPNGKSNRFDRFTDAGIHFLAVTTDLDQGRLELLTSAGPRKKIPNLVDGLLASSAFPFVFRPRFSWEVFPQPQKNVRYIDGGVMDNLPLGSVARFLVEAARHSKIVFEPDAPHLIFTASLEPRMEQQETEQASVDAEFWGTLRRRAGQLRYNQKLRNFARAQKHIRQILRLPRPADHPPPPDLLDLDVLWVEPEWLCGTFAFHPMLGFRRRKNAASIAHGCAATLIRLGAYARDAAAQRGDDWLDEWGLAQNCGVDPARVQESSAPRPRRLSKSQRASGQCWFRRDGHVCPFSPARLNEHEDVIQPATRRAVADIYKCCGQKRTHQRPSRSGGI